MSKSCSCRSCIKESDPKSLRIADFFLELNLVCPKCWDRKCPQIANHRDACLLDVTGPSASEKQAA